MIEIGGDGCNCLIDTIRQQFGAQCDVAAVRAALERTFPDILPGVFLVFHLHCSEVACLVLEHNLETVPATLSASGLHVVCIDMNHIGSGDVLGN